MKHHQYPEERKEAEWNRRLRRMGYEVDYHCCSGMVVGSAVERADAEDGVSKMEATGLKRHCEFDEPVCDHQETNAVYGIHHR